MRRVSFLKKIKLFLFWRRVIKDNKEILSKNFNIRVDRAQRLYTVVNINPELIGDAYILKKSDIDKISQNYIKEYSLKLGEFLTNKGLAELYSVYDIKKEEKYSYAVIYGFKFFKSNKFYDRLYFRFIPTILILIALLLFLF